MDFKEAREISYWVYALFGGPILWIGVVGNVLAIVYFLFKEKNRSSYTTHILFLAIFDLVGCLAFICDWLQYLHGKWYFGSFGCKILKPFGFVFIYISSWLIVGMSYERYQGITKPLTSQIKRKHVYAYVLILCVIWTLTYAHVFMIGEVDANGQCFSFRPLGFGNKALAFFIAKITAGTIIPSILMAYFYFGIRKTLKKQQKTLQNTDVLRRNKAVMGTLRMLIIVFILCIDVVEIVYMTFFGLLYSESTVLYQPWSVVFQGFMWSYRFVNNAVNCFVYAGYIKGFRNWLFCLFCPVTIEFKRRTMQDTTRSKRTMRN